MSRGAAARLRRRALLLLLLAATAASGTARAAHPAETAAPPALPRPDLSSLPGPARRHVESLQAALAAALAADPAAPEVAEGFAFLGRVLYAYELFAAAEQALSIAVERAPDDLDARYLRGLARSALADFGGAAEDFRSVAARQTEAVAPPLRLGEALLASGRPEEAREAFAEALARNRPNAAAEYGLGRAAAALGDPAEAARHFETALSQQPSATVVHAPLAEAYRLLGDDGRARRHQAAAGDGVFTFADPVSEGVARIQALTAFETVQEMAARDPGFDEAAFLDFVLERFARTPDALLQLRTLLARLDGTAAEEVASPPDAAAPLTPEGPAPAARLRGRLRYAVGGLLLRQGRDEEAIPELTRAVELDPALRDARLQLADALARRGRWGEALAGYDALLALTPDRAEALIRRAAARANLATADDGTAGGGAADLVRSDLERAVATATDPAILAEAHAALARVELTAGHPQTALGEYRRALAADPEQREALAGLAALLGRHGDYAEAAATYRRLVALAPRDPEARMGEAVALILAGDYAAARDRLAEAVAALPDDLGLQARLARLLAASPDHAVRDGARAVELAQAAFAAAPSAEAVETLAMAFAEAGDFQQAMLWQRRLLAAGDSGTDPDRPRRLRNLERYASGRSCCAGDDDPPPGRP